MSDLATLKVVVDASGAIRVVDQFGKSVADATQKANALNDAAKRVGTVVGTTLVAGLALAVKETSDAQREQAQLAAALRSTGGAAGQTLESLNDHATALRRVTAATGGQISEAQALLLTFTKIGGDVFPQATMAALDMAQALGTDARSAAMQLGKALNDPILGVTALGRAGVQFSPTQKAMIEGFVQTNQLAKAQGIILAELQTQVGGSAAAYRNTLGGALAAVRESFLELFEVSSPGMKGLVEEINLVADSIAQIPTLLQMAATGTQSFLNKALIAALEFNQRGRPSAMLDNARARQTQFDTDASGLRALLEQQRQDAINAFLARANAGMGGVIGGGGTPPTIPDVAVVTAAVEAVDKLNRNLKAMTKAVDDDTALRDKQDKRTKAALSETTVAVEALSESARVFLEQTQMAVGRFFSDLLKDGFSSIGRFWENFKQLGREALGNVFAKEVMERYGKGIAEKVGGWVGGALGKIGGLGASVLGPLAAIGGITAGVVSLFGRTSKWEEAAEAQNKAARAQLAAAESLRQSVQQRQASFLNDFLNYANTETPQQREIRSLTNQRQALAQDAFDIAKLGGGSLSRQVTQLLSQGNFSNEVAALIRRDALGFNQTDLGRQSLLDFAKALEDLNKAFQNNALAAEKAARAQGILTLSQFRDSLNLSAQSPLSPTAQLAEARRQYDVILALARNGDQSAIASLPETARTLLDASRAVNASGVRYAQDFAKVQADTASIIEELQRVPNDVLDVTDTIIETFNPYFDEAISIADASLTVQQAGFQSVVEELVNVRAELTTMKNALKLSLEELAAAQ